MRLLKGEIYKIKHHDITIGENYKRFTAKSNCIIFSPLYDMELQIYKAIPCIFIVSFERNLLLPGDNNFKVNPPTTMFSDSCTVEEVSKHDYETIIGLSKQKKIPYFLSKTNYRYNRKLDKLIHNGVIQDKDH